ncbi:MAG: hypothetical protein IT223_02035 [Crocinitomicaceae bacterium]|nr:hypothetical protein [Crocinitomicaceae bacterium]
MENDRHNNRIKTPFNSVEELVETSNTILNRRKSRAGKSLEHHLAEVFSNRRHHYIGLSHLSGCGLKLPVLLL